MNANTKGEGAFDDFYRELYGGRWRDIREALGREPTYTTVGFAGCAAYHLASASKIAAEALGIEPSMKVVDLCAAPGGKTLVLAKALDGRGSLVANERSRARRERLKRVLNEHLPDVMRLTVVVTGHDARRWCLYETEAFDAALLDVPCSAERHLLSNPRELNRWSQSRTKRLAAQSYAMLASTLEIVRPNGKILYSTCSLSPAENDDVIERLRRKRPGRFAIVSRNGGIGELTNFGTIFLPDVSGGAGPLYFTVLERTR